VSAGLLFSAVRDLQPRYLEAVTPAIAAAIGIAGAGLVRRADRRGTALLLGLALGGSIAFALTVGSVPDAALSVCVIAGGLAGILLLAGALRAPTGRLRRGWLAGLGVACAATILAPPVGVSIDLVDANATAAGMMGSGAEFAPYLHAHRHGAYYEVASSSVYGVATLVVEDAQPVLVLNDFHGPLVSLAKLQQLVELRAVRHIIISRPCVTGTHCPDTTQWSLKHAREVIRGGLYEYILPLSLSPKEACATAARRRLYPCGPPVKLAVPASVGPTIGQPVAGRPATRPLKPIHPAAARPAPARPSPRPRSGGR
jgi:4-amino-4-deoxy-L-arabinose transferase-like glycosyltransferase